MASAARRSESPSARWKWIALVGFGLGLIAHGAVLCGLIVVQPWMACFLVPPFLLHEAVTEPLLRHSPVPNSRRPRLVMWSRWATWQAALPYIPFGWRLFALPFCLVYAPLMFLGGAYFRRFDIAFSVLPAGVLIAEYVYLAFVIPNKREILAAVGHE